MWVLTVPWGYSSSASTLRGLLTNCGRPSSLSWTSARVGKPVGKPGDIRDRGLYSTLPIHHCANSVLYVDYTDMPKFGGYDFALLVTCGLTRFTRVFPCTKHITGEETIKILLEEWFCVYGGPKEINADEDVGVHSDTGWYKRVLRSPNVQVSTGIPYSHTSNPLCERQIRVLKENVRIWCKTERTRDWVRLLPVRSVMMNSQESSATG